MAEAVLLAVTKIGTMCLTDEVIRNWIAEAYHVEDVLQLEEEGYLMEYFIKGAHNFTGFSEIVHDVAAVEKEIQQVVLLEDQWLQHTQLVPTPVTEVGRQRLQDSILEFVKDEDTVGVEDSWRLLTSWLYSKEANNTVIVKLQRLPTALSIEAISPFPGVLSSVFSESSYLTALELQDSEITDIPASIGTLFNLRYIGLRRTKVRSLPDSVEKLSNLQALDIKQTKIEQLPPWIVKVRKLHHLLAGTY